MPLKNLFCLRSNLSIDEIISAQRRGLKTLTGVDFRGLAWKRGKPGGTLPPTIPRSMKQYKSVSSS